MSPRASITTIASNKTNLGIFITSIGESRHAPECDHSSENYFGDGGGVCYCVRTIMTDFHFGAAMAVWLASLILLYVVRLALRGRARHERTDSHGGSPFLAQSIMEMGYWGLSPLMDWLVTRRITPDHVTWFSLLPGLGAGVAAAFGWFGLACLLGTMAAFADIIDGVLARRMGISSEAGEVLDAAIDRYTESALLVGLTVYYRNDLPWMLLSAGALVGGFMVSYTTAKAEAAHVTPPRGSMRRAERAVYLLTAAGFTSLTKEWFATEAPILFAIALVSVVANISAIRRFATLMRSLR
ncbi:MAG: CDP-alcohol phosphatidyltransferase family protein [Acidobacteria bacterium]|nr:CDP-alcohol phosphatidyltransferase family protein [Acidobacteriota bacterium]